MIYLSFDQVVELHDALIQKFGGLPGLRELGLLESALAGPMMAVFGEELHKSVYDKAAAYLFYITRNHPFFDGNKRTASAVALVFLRTNGASPKYDANDFLEFVVSIAEGKLDLKSISSYLKGICEI